MGFLKVFLETLVKYKKEVAKFGFWSLVAIGLLLLFEIILSAVLGNLSAVLVVGAFLVSVLIVSLMAVYIWNRNLSGSDNIYRTFKAIASELRTSVASFSRTQNPDDNSVSFEKGYRLAVERKGVKVSVSLVDIGKETFQPAKKFGNQKLITISRPIRFNFSLVFVNRVLDVPESFDIELYMPALIGSKRYSFTENIIVFSDCDQDTLDQIMSSQKLRKDLDDLFRHYGYKFAVLYDRRILIAKNVDLDSDLYFDLGAYDPMDGVVSEIEKIKSPQFDYE